MRISAAGLMLCTFLVGCGGTAPFGEGATDGDGSAGGSGEDGGDAITREGLPPGTTSPAANTTIFRKEPTSTEAASDGDGFATGISYDGANDTFTVDGLAFDGGNVYQRGTAVSSLNNGAFAVYEADSQFPDSVSADPVNQFTHRAIYGVSRNRNANGVPNTQFAIVRTGAYVGYGFGGFIYQRDNTVTLPASGQATFTGTSAGLRDYNGRGGLEYTTANVELAVDFDDFNAQTAVRGGAVRGSMSNRRVFDINGNDITSQLVAQINAKNEASLSQIPTARFKVGPGALDANGEALGEVFSTFVADDGSVKDYESGNYYAIMSGANPDEIVGVVVLENSAETDNVTARETSGFIVYRGDAPAQ